MDNNVKFWNKMSRFYKLFQEKGNKKIYLEISNKCKKYILDKDVLELACGSGQISVNLSNVASYYLATDYSIKMINEANKRDIKNITFKQMDATNIDSDDSSFDVVIIANALHIMNSPDLCLKEIKRVLKNDGILIAPTFIYDSKPKGIKLWVSNKLGFKTYHKWKGNELIDYITSFSYSLIKNEVIKANPLDIEFVVVRNIK